MSQDQNLDPFGDDFNKAGPNDGVFMLPGGYLLDLIVCKIIKSTNPKHMGALMMVTEWKILESTVAERPVGSTVSWIVNFKHASAKSSSRGFLAKACGVNHDDITDVRARGLVQQPSNILGGTKMRAQATQTPTRDGNEFTKVSWSLVQRSPGIEALNTPTQQPTA